jgi:hypothetical protein
MDRTVYKEYYYVRQLKNTPICSEINLIYFRDLLHVVSRILREFVRVTPASQICASAMLLLLILGNYEARLWDAF